MGDGLKRAKKAAEATRKPEVKKGESWRLGYSAGCDETAKAYGGCDKCYGKGYSTQGHAGRTQIHTCVCPRGKQLDELLLKVQSGDATVIV